MWSHCFLLLAVKSPALRRQQAFPQGTSQCWSPGRRAGTSFLSPEQETLILWGQKWGSDSSRVASGTVCLWKTLSWAFLGKVYLLFSGKAVFENLSLFSAHNCTISLSFSVAIWPYLPLRSLQGSVCSQLGTCCLLVPSHLGTACPGACRSVCLKSIQLLLFLCLPALLPWFGLCARPTELVKMGLLKIADFFS